MKYALVSACLLGIPCRYDGGAVVERAMSPVSDGWSLIPVCPEQLGGLPTPRQPAERRGDAVVTREGTAVTTQFEQGAQCALRIARMYHAGCALLKSRSPSCGAGQIYDGTFTGRLTVGDGVTARLLRDNGVALFDEAHIDEFIEYMDRDSRDCKQKGQS